MNIASHINLETEHKTAGPAVLQWLLKHRWFMLFVMGPTIIAGLYYCLFASDIYISESRFVIKSPDQKRGQISTLANLIQTTGLSSGQEQTNEVLAYVRSRDALAQLNKNINVDRIFSSADIDFYSRYPDFLANKSFEELYKYYGKMVDVSLDTETGTAIIKVHAFSPGDAYQINAKLLDLSEQLVNRLNDRAQSRGIGEAEKQVELATARARAARTMVAKYRNSQEVIDPAKQVGGVLDVSNKIVAERAGLQAQLDLLTRMTPKNPAIPALRDRITALSAQIAAQDSRLVGSNAGIASKIGGYENLLVEQEFATATLNAANAALVQARADAQRQQFYLERVVAPNLPDAPLLPRRIMNIIIVAATSLCLYFVGWMFVIGILEHSPEDQPWQRLP